MGTEVLRSMYGVLIDELNFVRRQHRPKSINERMENVILSLAHLENQYRDRYGNDSGISFETWLSGGLKGVTTRDFRSRYVESVLRPINQYHRVHEFNECKDAYYQAKLDAGLIVPLTEEEMKKRSYSPKPATKKTDEAGTARAVIQGNDREITFTEWFDHISDGFLADNNPVTLYLVSEAQEEKRGRFIRSGFTPKEADAIVGYYEIKGDLKGKRGAKQEICDHLGITRDKLNWLLKRVDKLIAKVDQSA